MRALPAAGLILSCALAGCGGGGAKPEQRVEAALRLAGSARVEERIAGLRRLLRADAPEISTLRPLLRRRSDPLSPAEEETLLAILEIGRRRDFGRQVSASPRGIHCIPWEPDPHYRGGLLLKKRIARDEPLLLSIALSPRVDGARGLLLHHFDAEWALAADLPEDALAKQRRRSEPVHGLVTTGGSPGESVFPGRIGLADLGSLFERLPGHSPALAPALETRTLHARLRFFICPSAEGAEAAYRTTPWIPIEVVNAPQAILLDDRERYPPLLASHLAPEDPRAAQRARMDAYVPGLCDPARLLACLAATRDPASAGAILRELEAFAPVGKLDAIRVSRANEGDLASILSLARDLPLHPAGHVLEGIPLPAEWDRLSPRHLRPLLESGTAEEALAGARLLAATRQRDREVSLAYVRRLAEARAESPGRFDALLALADRLARPADFPAIAPFLVETRVLAPEGIPSPHPLWTSSPPAHDVRACDAAAAAFLRLAGLDGKGFWEDPRERRVLAPPASRDEAIARVKAWWDRNRKRYS